MTGAADGVVARFTPNGIVSVAGVDHVGQRGTADHVTGIAHAGEVGTADRADFRAGKRLVGAVALGCLVIDIVVEESAKEEIGKGVVLVTE